MIKYSKPIGELFKFKTDFLNENDRKLRENIEVNNTYQKQELRTHCKLCDTQIGDNFPRFEKLGIEYSVCQTCTHINGAHEDSKEFCDLLYTDDGGKSYAANYSANDAEAYEGRLKEIYVPKAQFLWDSLKELGEAPTNLSFCDIGAGAGYFVGAAERVGFQNVKGMEPSETMVTFGNTALGKDSLTGFDANNVIELARTIDAEVVSFVGVLEHLRELRGVLKGLEENPAVKYIFFLVPMMAPTVALETVMQEVMPRHLVAGHTHLFTEQSIDHFCKEFSFKRRSEWWFGLDAADFWRSILVMLQKQPNSGWLVDYWKNEAFGLVNGIQEAIDQKKICTDVHMLLSK